MARLPLIENRGYWDIYGSYYYGDESPPAQDGKLDVRDERLLYAQELRRAAELGGNAEEILNTTLIFSAWSASCEMMLSPAVKALRTVLGLPFDADGTAVAERVIFLRERAEALLYGAALVGALRAIAHFATRYRGTHKVRKSISDRVHDLTGTMRLRVGRAAALADDGHAHLDFAQRLIVPAQDDPNRIGDLRASIAHTGLLYLTAAVACAFEEPWSPFTSHLLRHEIGEHSSCVDHVQPDRQVISEVLTAAMNEYLKRYERNSKRFEELVAAGRNDLDVYFTWPGGWDTGDPPAPGTEELYGNLRDFREAWPTWRKIV